VVLLGARWHVDLGVLAPIYFCPLGTIFVFSLKMVSTVACCVRLNTKNS